MIQAAAIADDVVTSNVHRQRIIEQRGAPSAASYAALVIASKTMTDDATVASNLFAESQSLGVKAHTHLYNVVISAPSCARRVDEALALFARMKQEGVRQSFFTYETIIRACSQIGDEQTAKYLYEQMFVQPGMRHRVSPFNTMIHSNVHRPRIIQPRGAPSAASHVTNNVDTDNPSQHFSTFPPPANQQPKGVGGPAPGLGQMPGQALYPPQQMQMGWQQLEAKKRKEAEDKAKKEEEEREARRKAEEAESLKQKEEERRKKEAEEKVEREEEKRLRLEAEKKRQEEEETRKKKEEEEYLKKEAEERERADVGSLITSISATAFRINGGFGDVFTGTHSVLGKVALKRPRTTLADLLRRLQREAAIWGRLQHPHILKYPGTFERDGFLYIVSPFIENGTLLEYISQHPSVNRVKLLCEAADAICYVHAQDVVHGDIKASNLLADDKGQVLLCDFGLTKTTDSGTSTAMHGAGSLRWQSLELLNGASKSFKSDVYAFGMTIAEVLTGNIPFPDCKVEGAVFSAIFNGRRPPKDPAMSSTGLSYKTVWTVAEACWSEKPEERISMDEAWRLIEEDLISP